MELDEDYVQRQALALAIMSFQDAIRELVLTGTGYEDGR